MEATSLAGQPNCTNCTSSSLSLGSRFWRPPAQTESRRNACTDLATREQIVQREKSYRVQQYKIAAGYLLNPVTAGDGVYVAVVIHDQRRRILDDKIHVPGGCRHR